MTRTHDAVENVERIFSARAHIEQILRFEAALARAQAVDVTAVLVFGAVVTAVLSGAADGLPLDAFGLALVTVGVAVAAVASLRQPVARGAPS